MSSAYLKTGAKEPYRILSAHRGGGCEGAENTQGAFNNAMKLGMNLMECDVHLTKDNVVVVCHDSKLDRLCGLEYGDRGIGDYNLNELPKLQRQLEHHFATGLYTLSDNEDGLFTTLREMFENCKEVYISIDCKGGGERLCTEVNSLVKEFRREQITVWGSMYPTNHD
jgi:glycerophosphoryl diester phosphodiesterase